MRTRAQLPPNRPLPNRHLQDNPEYGLRLILTFQPSMSFLTPLDKCMALAKTSMLSATHLPGTDPQHDLHYRQQALRFLQVCVKLSSVWAPRRGPNRTGCVGVRWR